jgi:hypothetical protein
VTVDTFYGRGIAGETGDTMSNTFPLIQVCMLCARNRGQDGVWRNMMDLPQEEPSIKSHGLCDECREDIAKDLAPLLKSGSAQAS